MKNLNILKTLSILCTVFILNSCDNTASDPIALEFVDISIIDNQETTFTSMKVNTELAYENESEIISYGICWSSNPQPTIEDNKTIENTKIFTSLITGLTVNTEYYFRAYTTNNNGTTYSEERIF